jgi:hypothetical protein
MIENPLFFELYNEIVIVEIAFLRYVLK